MGVASAVANGDSEYVASVLSGTFPTPPDSQISVAVQDAFTSKHRAIEAEVWAFRDVPTQCAGQGCRVVAQPSHGMPASPVEIEAIDGVLPRVVVRVGTASRDGVGLQESAKNRRIQPHAHEDQTAGVIARAAFAAEPAVAAAGAGGVVAKFVVVGLDGGRGRAGCGGGGYVAVQVGVLVGGGAGLVDGDGEAAQEIADVGVPAGGVAAFGGPGR